MVLRYICVAGCLLLLGSPTMVNAQTSDSTLVKSTAGSTNAELADLMSYLTIEKHHIEFDDLNLAGKVFHLTSQEYREGIAQPEQDLTNQFRNLFTIDELGEFAFDVYTRATDANTIEVALRFPRVHRRMTFDAVKDRKTEYQFETDMLPFRRGQTKVPIGKKFVFMVLALPCEISGYVVHCGLFQHQIPIADWYKIFGVKHFVVYQLTLE